MIEFPTKKQLADLIQCESGRCVSVLMRTHESGRETTQNPIRFKNLINDAIGKAEGVEDNTLERLKELTVLEDDFEFWQHQRAGFALYVCDGFEQRFSLDHTPDEAAYLGQHFQIRPLASPACRTLSARILALSWESARLYESDGHQCREVTTEAFPVSYYELVVPRDAEEQLQYSSHAKGRGGSQVVMYHGHGEGEEKIEADRADYLSRVGELVSKSMYNSGQPLLLLATEEVAGHFTSVTDVDVAERIDASPDGMEESVLTEKMNVAARDVATRAADELKERLGTALSGGAGSTDLSEIITEAARGRIDTLLLGDDEPIHGRFDRDKYQVHIDDDAPDDLVNIAVRETLIAGGDIVDISAGTIGHAAAAIYRF